jgi:protein O-GlcNAc transferase
MRIRLDRLDLWMDLTYFTPTCRIEIPAMRVAPVQVRRQNWQRMQRPPCEYGIGDTFTHPGPIGKLGSGAIARMPSTCWLGTDAELPQTTAALTRRQAGLPASGTVLCAFAQAAVLIDPLTWGCWMRILAGLPDALLWLPEFDAATRGHLLREAQAAGIGPDRLVFSPRLKRSEMLARLPLADLYLDPLRFNSPQMAADAMRAGVPAITCAGGNMASRLGGSVVTAAGMPECVVFDPASYEALAIRLGRDAAVRGAVRSRLLQAHATAPLFNMAARVREWENAWTTMVERQRAGLPAQAFDVTPANP